MLKEKNVASDWIYLSCKLGCDVLLLLFALCLGEALDVLGPVQVLHVVLGELGLTSEHKLSMLEKLKE